LCGKTRTATPIDLTGCTARLKVKRGNTELLSLTSGDGVTLGGDAGTIELEIEFANGDVKRLLNGAVMLRREVTV
jgi:hypothetical protein